MKSYIYTILMLVALQSTLVAQIETNTNSRMIKAKETPSYLQKSNTDSNFSLSTPSLSKPNTSGLQMKSTIGSGALSTEVDRVKALKNADLKEYKTDTPPKAFSDTKEGAVDITQYQKDEYLGEFTTKSAYVQILYRDHQTVDGDLVAVYRNEEVEEEKLLLHGQFRKVQLELIPGFNKIDIMALNNGEGAPNTGHFLIYDDQGAVITDSKWAIAPGFRASFIIVKE